MFFFGQFASSSLKFVYVVRMVVIEQYESENSLGDFACFHYTLELFHH